MQALFGKDTTGKEKERIAAVFKTGELEKRGG
jgi:hypothetical protein